MNICQKSVLSNDFLKILLWSQSWNARKYPLIDLFAARDIHFKISCDAGHEVFAVWLWFVAQMDRDKGDCGWYGMNIFS